jgi:hypothetical protein
MEYEKRHEPDVKNEKTGYAIAIALTLMVAAKVVMEIAQKFQNVGAG